MMRKVLKKSYCILVFVPFGLFDVFGRTNEKQIWNIEKIIFDYSKAQDRTRGGTKSGSETNVGTFTFNGDGTGSYSYTLDGIKRAGTFVQGATSDSYISLTNQRDLSIQNLYTIVKQDNENIELSVKEMAEGEEQFLLNAKFYLSKK